MLAYLNTSIELLEYVYAILEIIYDNNIDISSTINNPRVVFGGGHKHKYLKYKNI
jgi:hypothetical protein